MLVGVGRGHVLVSKTEISLVGWNWIQEGALHFSSLFCIFFAHSDFGDRAVQNILYTLYSSPCFFWIPGFRAVRGALTRCIVLAVQFCAIPCMNWAARMRY